jgi:protein TonB
MMMSRRRTGAIASLKLLFVIPVVGFIMVIISSYRAGYDNDINPDLKVSATSNIRVVPLIRQSDDLKEPEQMPPPPPPAPKVTIELIKEEVIADKTEEVPTEVFVVVEEMPLYPGGDKAMMEFIYKNINYPEVAKENNIQGRVVLRFVVKYNGEVGNITVIKGVDPSLDDEAIRVIGSLPAWKPGRQGGKPVNVWYSVPVTFQLK